jgi:hypothetical protein
MINKKDFIYTRNWIRTSATMIENALSAFDFLLKTAGNK